MRTYPSRESFLPELCSGKVCVEVGVHRGEYAQQILDHGRPRILCLVDLWRTQRPEIYTDVANVDQQAFDEMYADLLERHRHREPQVRFLRMDSLQAADLMRDESLDWVYLDANHAKEAVLRDLAAWWPKLVPGGWLCGHDYAITSRYANGQVSIRLEVGEALREWLPTIGRTEVDFTTVKGDSYGIRKPLQE